MRLKRKTMLLVHSTIEIGRQAVPTSEKSRHVLQTGNDNHYKDLVPRLRENNTPFLEQINTLKQEVNETDIEVTRVKTALEACPVG